MKVMKSRNKREVNSHVANFDKRKTRKVEAGQVISSSFFLPMGCSRQGFSVQLDLMLSRCLYSSTGFDIPVYCE